MPDDWFEGAFDGSLKDKPSVFDEIDDTVTLGDDKSVGDAIIGGYTLYILMTFLFIFVFGLGFYCRRKRL